MSSVAAIDLGATSGRVITGRINRGRLHLRHVARFPNTPVRVSDGLHWDVLSLYLAAMNGLGQASREDLGLIGAAVDSWAVDYGLLRGTRLLGNPYHYRDARTETGVKQVHARINEVDLYARNGLQHLPFNTLFQLAASAAVGELESADRVLLIPDLIGYWATGRQVAERTNASTTGLLRVDTADWDWALLPWLGLRPDLLPALVEAGEPLGPIGKHVATEFGIAPDLSFSTVGSHDTASAVAGTPLQDEGSVYISCGTWSLVGAELRQPITTDAARTAGFTNEGGVDGRTRFLKNVMGLWLLSESVRTWEKAGQLPEFGVLLRQAAEARSDVAVFDASDPRLLAPGDMPLRITALMVERGQQVPASIPELVRSILQSLAVAYAKAITDLEALTGKSTTSIHLTGGGAQNALLCQLTADATGLPVLAGPVEATAIGNLLVQARTHGLVDGDLEALRTIVARSFPPQRFEPRIVSQRS